MSNIAEALKKAEAASGAPADLPPSPSIPPPWIYRAALVGCVAVVLLGMGIAAFTHRPAIRAAGSAQTARAPAAASDPAGTRVQRLLQLAQADLVLTGIIQSRNGGSLALINHQVVQEGDQIHGMRVAQVNPKSVELQDNEGATKTLQLKD